MHIIYMLISTHENKWRLAHYCQVASTSPLQEEQSQAVVGRKELTRIKEHSKSLGSGSTLKEHSHPTQMLHHTLSFPIRQEAEKRGAKEKGTNSILLRKISMSCNHFEQAAPGFYWTGDSKEKLATRLHAAEARKPYISEDALVMAPLHSAGPPSGQRRHFSKEASSKPTL